MNETEKLEIWERKIELHTKAHGLCEECGEPVSLYDCQISHIVPKTKLYLKTYGPEVIHHDDNVKITHGRCNQKVLMDPKTHPLEAEKHIQKIKEKIDKKGI